MNKVILSGRVAKEIVLKSEGYAFMSLIVDRNDNGVTEGKSGMLVSILVPDKVGINASKLLKVGDFVEVDARLNVGNDFKNFIIANRFQKTGSPAGKQKSKDDEEKSNVDAPKEDLVGVEKKGFVEEKQDPSSKVEDDIYSFTFI